MLSPLEEKELLKKIKKGDSSAKEKLVCSNLRFVVSVAINFQNQVIFLIINNKEAPLQGPTLQELPGVLKEIEKDTNLNFVDALNLDGGAHSAFINETVTVTELSTIGSYFCVR